eukprot:Seg9080.2 transcript_id=Seg9080.2/GoldUCD/mRNA.D3Y31 product=Nidogen-2 protein_id=Seg9080.2/GoldUCD/D3Y31
MGGWSFKAFLSFFLLSVSTVVTICAGDTESQGGENGPCKIVEKKALKAGLIGSYIPQCKDNGYYLPLQCHASTGICWCTNRYGERVPDSLMKETECDNPCFKKILDNPPPTILVQGAPRPIIINEAVPTCDPQGFYKPKQCNNELCWCVDKMGNEYRNTRGVPDTVNCL